MIEFDFINPSVQLRPTLLLQASKFNAPTDRTSDVEAGIPVAPQSNKDTPAVFSGVAGLQERDDSKLSKR